MLQELADVLQAPKKFLWSMLPGLHDPNSGEAYTGEQVAHNAFGTDPEGVWGKVLGFGLDVAGDPLNLIAPLAARGIGAAARGLSGLGRAGVAAGKAAAPAATAAADVGEGLGAGLAALAPEESALTRQLAIRPHQITGTPSNIPLSADPIPSATAAAEAAENIPWRPSSISGIRGARDTFGMIKNVRPVPEGMEPLLAQALEPGGAGLPRRLVTDRWGRYIGEASGSVPRTQEYNQFLGMIPGGLGEEAISKAAPDIVRGTHGGAFFPYEGPGTTTGIGVSSGPINNRHEVFHGLVNAVAGGHPTANMPMSVAIPGMIGRIDRPFAQGLSQILNEAGAHAAESRNTMEQIRNYLGFLYNPDPRYYDQIGKVSKLAKDLHIALPALTAGAGAGGLFLGGKALTTDWNQYDPNRDVALSNLPG